MSREITRRALSLGFDIPVWRTQDYFESSSIGRLPRDIEITVFRIVQNSRRALRGHVTHSPGTAQALALVGPFDRGARGRARRGLGLGQRGVVGRGAQLETVLALDRPHGRVAAQRGGQRGE